MLSYGETKNVAVCGKSDSSGASSFLREDFCQDKAKAAGTADALRGISTQDWRKYTLKNRMGFGSRQLNEKAPHVVERAADFMYDFLKALFGNFVVCYSEEGLDPIIKSLTKSNDFVPILSAELKKYVIHQHILLFNIRHKSRDHLGSHPVDYNTTKDPCQ